MKNYRVVVAFDLFDADSSEYKKLGEALANHGYNDFFIDEDKTRNKLPDTTFISEKKFSDSEVTTENRKTVFEEICVEFEEMLKEMKIKGKFLVIFSNSFHVGMIHIPSDSQVLDE